MTVWELIDKHPLPQQTWTAKKTQVSIEGKWAHIRQFVEVLRRDGWKETMPVTGEPSGFKFTSVEFER